ncbi:MAG TPA: PIN domain-containing protein [Rhizomicrobium sp.]|jgi:predicted nucleic acid-binding protein|nr:PIN domain-containing protein [Rhizomicrobium sp.]
MLTVDANVLVYSQDGRDPRKQLIAREIIAGLHPSSARMTTIVLGEFFRASTRKLLTMLEARRCLEDFFSLVPVVRYSEENVLIAAAMAHQGRFSFWDGVILSCAEDAGCTICLSEDMADGARCGKITVRNPFGPRGLAPEIRALLLP